MKLNLISLVYKTILDTEMLLVVFVVLPRLCSSSVLINCPIKLLKKEKTVGSQIRIPKHTNFSSQGTRQDAPA